MGDFRAEFRLSLELQRILAAYQDAKKIGTAIRSGLQDYIGESLDPATQENLSNKILKRRTGSLSQSTRWKIRKSRGSLDFVVSALSGTPYGAILEHGGTIKPKTKKFLTIPLPGALTPAGVLKKSAPEWDNTFFHKSAAGNLVLLQSKGQAVVPLFLLLKQVRIPAFQWASRSFDSTSGNIPMYIKQRLPG